MKTDFVFLLFTISIIVFSSCKQSTNSNGGEYQANKTNYRDIYPDTWVATDALGRTMPGYKDVGPLKKDKRRVVGIFYITWHTMNGYSRHTSPYSADVTKILEADPGARLDPHHPLWATNSFHWGEPEMGYFLSQDEYVIRKDMAMLANAGVDVLILDVTNAVRYWDEWEVLFNTMEKIKADGNKVPKFCFWAFNGPVITVVQDLYDAFYKTERFKDLWFYWDDKPLLLYNETPNVDATGGGYANPNPNYEPDAVDNKDNPHYGNPYYTQEFFTDYPREIKDFFTKRNLWWGYYEWNGERYVGTEDNWSFGYDLSNSNVKNMNPDDLISTHNGEQEQAAVTPAQHPSSLVGKSWSRENGEPELNKYDLPVPTYVPWLDKTVNNPEGYGIYFQERWEEALANDPAFIYLNDWNEWTAGKYHDSIVNPFMRRNSGYYFVDQYNAEFNRCIQPMKDGYTDNYLMQMAENIRRYKGVRPIPELKGYQEIKIDGSFKDWENLDIEYRDTKGDVFHRDFKGYGGMQYRDTSGRNDIITSKVAVNKEEIAFYAETDTFLTSYKDENWMLLLIDADNNSATGWYGYDFIVNKKVNDLENTVLMQYNQEAEKWDVKATLNYSYTNNQLELKIPRAHLGLNGNQFTFDFKWSDNPAGLTDPISLCKEGDTAPNRRYNYRCIWSK